jgi:hypothetical protein
MEFTDYMIYKAIALCIVAFVYNFWLGFTGRSSPEQEHCERPPERTVRPDE